MPGPGGASGGGRPPWVRDSTEKTTPTPSQPPAWTLRKRSQPSVGPQSSADQDQPTLNQVEEQLASVKANLKKKPAVSKTENGVKAEIENTIPKPPKKNETLKKVEPEVKAKAANENVVEKLPIRKPPLAKQPSAAKDDVISKKPPVLLRQTSKEDTSAKRWRDPLLEKVKEKIDNTIANEIPKGHTLTKNESLRSLLKPVPPPLPPPMPPKLPPPPDFKKAPTTSEKLKKIESLKSRPRKRPDWSDMMKEVESGRKLKHVVCNDRSSPIITKSNMVKAKGQYVYESEKGNMHNQLLKQINQGIKLKQVKTNDRSKPNLDGLRKFRRQMTIEEQIQKSMSQANMSSTNLSELKEAAPEEEDVDEMDDIDKVRDDLQSTKQLLALELRNKEAQQRENKRLLSRITNLEAELASERAHIKQEQAKTVISVVDAYDETLVTSLKREVADTKRVADDLQKKYHRAAEELDDVQAELDEVKRRNTELEKKLEQALKSLERRSEEKEDEPKSYFLLRTREYENQVASQGIAPNSNQSSRRPSHAQRQQSVQEVSTEEEEEESSGDEGEDEEAKQARRNQRELKMLGNKIKNLKEKKEKAKKEREGLKIQLKNQQKGLKEEKKKYKALKKEVDKMAKLMKESEDEENEDGDDEEEEEEQKEEMSEEESESETEEESESETESESEEEEAPVDKKKENLSSRAKKHETSLSALKKGNYLIIANIERLKDDISKQREESVTLQEDLDSLLVEFE